jgi:hypothetical protein
MVRRRYFFLHLQKTAGTALWQRLNEEFTAEQVYPGPGDGSPPESTISVPHLRERWAARGDEIMLVAGHFPLCTTELLGGGFTTFTILRDPVERVLSGLRHHRQLTPSAVDTPLEELYEDPIRRELLRNHMVKMLSLETHEMTDGAMSPVSFTPARLDAAKAALARIDVVGTQNRFDEFCNELERRFGWNLGSARFANRTRAIAVDDSFRARLADDNADDIELYRHSLTLAV